VLRWLAAPAGDQPGRTGGVRGHAALLVWLAQLKNATCGGGQGSESTRDSGEGGGGAAAAKARRELLAGWLHEPAGSSSTSEPTGLTSLAKRWPGAAISRSFPTPLPPSPKNLLLIRAGLFSSAGGGEGQGPSNARSPPTGWSSRAARHSRSPPRAPFDFTAGSTINLPRTPPGHQDFSEGHLPHPGRRDKRGDARRRRPKACGAPDPQAV